MISYLNSKHRASVWLIFALASMGIFTLSSFVAPSFCDEYTCLVIGVALTLVAIPLHRLGKKHNIFYVVSLALNSIATGIAAAAYYVWASTDMKIYEMMLSALISALILVIPYLVFRVFGASKKLAVIIGVVLAVLLLAGSVAMWILHGGLLFVSAFFCSVISLVYMCVFGISADQYDRLILRDLSFGGFGIFIIVFIVVLFVISEGDVDPGLDLGDSATKKNKKKKTKKI